MRGNEITPLKPSGNNMYHLLYQSAIPCLVFMVENKFSNKLSNTEGTKE
jgi:hypothetical protein